MVLAMILPLPGTIDSSVQPRFGRLPVLTMAVVMVLMVTFVMPRGAAVFGMYPWAESWLRMSGLLEASWTLYGDTELFQPWQLWTWVCIDSNGWLWLGNIIMTAVVLSGCEQRIGFALPFVALVLVLPCGAAAHLIASSVISSHSTVWMTPTIQVGAAACVTGLIGITWGCLKPVRLRYGLGWWAIIVVGWIPLGTVALPVLGVLWAMLDAYIHTGISCLIDICVLGLGMVVGVLLRKHLPWILRAY